MRVVSLKTCQDWETDLFGGAYDDAKPFERCKYGALGASACGQLQYLYIELFIFFVHL